jgi:hypothetical protein
MAYRMSLPNLMPVLAIEAVVSRQALQRHLQNDFRRSLGPASRTLGI